MDETDAWGARPGQGAIRFSHSGYRYLLGYGRDFFGIWDREKPGGPILRYPRTDDGWDEAWYEYSSREKHNVEVIAPDAAFAPTRTRARWTRAMLYLHAAGAIVAAAVLVSDIVRLAGLPADSGPALGEIEEQVSGMFALLVFVGFYPAPAAIAWLLWQYRAHQNLVALGTEDLQYTPGWAVAWWFVPGALFFMPYRTVRELWKASDPDAAASAWKQVERTPVLPLWWAAWLGALVLLFFGAAAGGSGDAPSLTAQAAWWAGMALLLAVAAILAATLVRQIEERQERKRTRVVPQQRVVPPRW